MNIPSYVLVKFKNNEVELTSELDNTVILIRGEKNISDFKEIYYNKNFNIDNKELIKKLMDNFMLLDLNKGQKLINQFKEYFYNNDTSLTLIPIITQNCNFRCIYCYEEHIPNIMSEDTLNGIVEYVKKEIKNGIKSVILSWFGGEPLLAKEKIIKYNKIIQNICEENNILFRGSMTTNGYLLDIQTFKDLYKAGVVSYQITLDGFEHDKKRILFDGSPTYEKIVSNLEQIKTLSNKEYKFKINLRRNILKGESFDWYDSIGKRLGNDERFSMYVRRVFTSEKFEGKNNEIIQDEEYLNEHLKYASKYFTNYVDEKNPNIGSGCCYAMFPKSFTILPDGSLQKCTCSSFVEEWQKVGKVIPNVGFEINEEKNKLWTMGIDITEECLGCEELLTCMNAKCARRYMDPSLLALEYSKKVCGNFKRNRVDE